MHKIKVGGIIFFLLLLLCVYNNTGAFCQETQDPDGMYINSNEGIEDADISNSALLNDSLEEPLADPQAELLSDLADPAIVDSQEAKSEEPIEMPATASISASQQIFYIRTIAIDSTGFTQRFAIMSKGEFVEGERIIGSDNLENYRQNKIQLLSNERVLDSVDISYTIGAPESDGSLPVDLAIKTVDTWNIIVLPYPRYDENDGFELTIKARDYNFLGTMNPLRIDLGYHLNPEFFDNFFSNLSKGSFLFIIDSDTPFRFMGYTWNFNFDHEFQYTYDQPLFYKNTTGLSIDFPMQYATATFGIEESIVANEDNKAKYGIEWEQSAEQHEQFKDFYMASSLFLSYRMPTGIKMQDYGEVIYSPKVSGTINMTPGGDIGDLRRGPEMSMSHSIGFGRIDWIENYRKGFSVSLSNTNPYNFYTQKWDSSVSFSAVGHIIVTKFFGIGAFAQYRQWFHEYNAEAGDALRGIINKAMPANRMLSVNLDFPFQVLRFTPSKWFNTPRLRYFDLDIHASPILDMALVEDPLHTIAFTPSDIQIAGGLEIIIYSHFMRSIYFRISLGINIREMIKTGKLPDGDNREIFFGLGHHF